MMAVFCGNWGRMGSGVFPWILEQHVFVPLLGKALSLFCFDLFFDGIMTVHLLVTEFWAMSLNLKETVAVASCVQFLT